MKTVYNLMLSLIICFGSCTKNIQTATSEKYQAVAIEKFGNEGFDCSENQDMTFALCKHQLSDQGATIQSWEFFVYDIKNEKVTYTETINRGSVKWFSDNEIQVSKTPGTMAEGQTTDDYTWIIDVKNGSKIKKSEYRKAVEN